MVRGGARVGKGLSSRLHLSRHGDLIEHDTPYGEPTYVWEKQLMEKARTSKWSIKSTTEGTVDANLQLLPPPKEPHPHHQPHTTHQDTTVATPNLPACQPRTSRYATWAAGWLQWMGRGWKDLGAFVLTRGWKEGGGLGE